MRREGENVRHIALGAIVATIAVAAFGATSAGAATYEEDVDVNIVFVGFEEGGPDVEDVLDELPDGSAPQVRSKLWYGLGDEADLSLEYAYDYAVVTPDEDWEDDFFEHLASIADPMPRTLFQDAYNDQDGTRDVGDNHWIDAPSVEEWLVANPPAGVDTTKPTVFFVDWYGREDFIDHVYVKTDEPDPDTGYNFGELRQSRKIVAWGGTAQDDEEFNDAGYGGRAQDHRVWFYDLSAGPELWAGGYNVTTPDEDGDGQPDYRIPPSWEYTGADREYDHPGFATATIGTDLGKVTRYVALDLLFTSSPLYPPAYTPNTIPGTVDLDVNTVEGWNQVNASDAFITPALFESEVNELPTAWSPGMTADYDDVKLNGDWNRCYKQFVSDKVCYNDLDPGYKGFGGFVNLFLVAARNTSSLLDGDADYEAGMLNWSIGQSPKSPGLLGFADDNWLNGTQSGVFSFVYPAAVAAGYGLTTTMIHEYGHHSSMSHPHDGYDSGDDVDFGPEGEHFFAWLGDESNSIMSYIDLNWDFGQFDRDNSARHHAAMYTKIALEILDDADVASEPEAAVANAKIDLAQMDLGVLHDYQAMLGHAKEAYDYAVMAADAAGVDVELKEPSTWSIVGPVKKGNGPNGKAKGKGLYAKDLDEKANVKRMFGK